MSRISRSPRWTRSEMLSVARDPRELRSEFLDRRGADAPPHMRDAVAHMLFELDRPEHFYRAGLGFLARALDAQRVDIGYGRPSASRFAAAAEFREDEELHPSVAGIEVDNGIGMRQAVWASPGPVSFEDIARDIHLGDTRDELLSVDARAMLALRVDESASGDPFAAICIDDLEGPRDWSVREQEFAAHFCGTFFGPLLEMRRALERFEEGWKPTPAELEAIRLASKGLRYKQIAQTLGKSVRTIEAQLRNARQRTGASNQAELVTLCEPWL